MKFFNHLILCLAGTFFAMPATGDNGPNGNDGQGEWHCYPAYSFQPDQEGTQRVDYMACRLDPETAGKSPTCFFIIAQYREQGKAARFEIPYSNESWWTGAFSYHPERQLAVLADQPDNANCSLRFIYRGDNQWKTSPVHDVAGSIDSSSWPAGQAWRCSLKSMSYDAEANTVEIRLTSSQGTHLIRYELDEQYRVVKSAVTSEGSP